MSEITEDLRSYLKGRRNISKTMFKIVGTICRGVNSGRFTYDQGLDAINNLRR